MSVEAEVASLKAQVDHLGTDVANQWAVIHKLSEHEQNDKLILYKLDEMKEKLDKHDGAELKRSEEHHNRIKVLESTHDEFKGTYRAIIGAVALGASLVGGAVTAAIHNLLTAGPPH